MEHRAPLGCVAVGFGAIFAIAGALIVLGAIVAPDRVYFTNADDVATPRWLTILFGLAFASVGACVFTLRKDSGPRAMRLAMGGIVVTFVVVILAGAIADPTAANFPAGRWMGFVAGAIFLLFAVLMLGARRLESRPHIAATAGVLLITLFAIVATTLAFRATPGSGGTVSILGFAFPSPDILDRGVIGVSALILDALAIVGWYNLVRTLRRS